MDDRQIQQNFHKFAEYFGFSYSELVNLLSISNAFIAGNVALNAFIQTELFNELNLDIFVHKPNEILISILKSKGYEYIENASNDLIPLNKEINSIMAYQSQKTGFTTKTIQIITIADCSIDDFLKSFSLNICKLAIISSPYKLHIYMDHLTYQEICEITGKRMYISKLVKPTNRFDQIDQFEKIEKQIKKYINHGFILTKRYDKTELSHMPWPTKIGNYLYDAYNNEVLTYEEFIKNEYK